MTKHSDHVFAVLLAGGGGTRLWPKSRNQTPKQFLKLTGKDTMAQIAANRIAKVVPWERIIVVTNKKYVADIQAQLPQVPADHIIAEPEKRDTAMAMLSGALFAANLDPEAIVVNSASDHVVANEHEFVRVMNTAIEAAADGQHLVTVGITPTGPETGFGYIKIRDAYRKADGMTIFHVDSFTEKPNSATARAFLSTGKYFWNANMYVWSVPALVQAFEQHMPDMLKAATPLRNVQPAEFHKNLPEAYAQAPSISIDYAISEKAQNLVLIPGDFGWNDVGDWKVVYELGKKDLQGNVIIGDEEQHRTVAINSQHNLIHTDGRLVGLVGVDDLIVVDTPEILLIASQDRSQDVKKIVERLKEEKQDEYL